MRGGSIVRVQVRNNGIAPLSPLTDAIFGFGRALQAQAQVLAEGHAARSSVVSTQPYTR